MLVRKIVAGLILLSAAFLAGYWARQPVGSARAGGRKVLYYHDPMHPDYKSDKPGIAPDCGMQLEPVYEGDPEPAPAGAIRIGTERQQLMGLATERVSRGSGAHTVRVLGRVAADEARIHRVTALADGVVRAVSSRVPGNFVRKNDLLASYFVAAREVYSAMQSYFVAVTLLEQAVDAKSAPGGIDAAKAQVRLAQELLETYGMTEAQMIEMARTRQMTRDIEFRSPVDGQVVLRNAAPGQRVDRGTELFRVAELSRVWVLADLFENESGVVSAGMHARVRYEGKTYPAVLSDVRQFDPGSRTLKVRLDLDNPGLVLRPDLFVDVEIDVKEPDGISVPVDAVLDSGRRSVVFVSSGSGVFEPREVVAGSRFGGRVRILRGLAEGENVVVSGVFLLDSESRLQLAAAASQKPAKAASAAADPVCGMEVDPAKAQHRSEYRNATYSFCSRSCKDKFDKDPVKYAAQKGGQS